MRGKGAAVVLATLAVLNRSPALVAGQCFTDDASSANYLSDDELMDQFRPQWEKIKSAEHEDPNEKASALPSFIDDGASAAGDGVIFVWGGKDKFGSRDAGFVFDPSACVCEEGEACSECDADEQIHGVWYADLPEDGFNTAERPEKRDDHVVVHAGNNQFLIYGGESKLWLYDLPNREYRNVSQIPAELDNEHSDLCAVAHGDRMWVFTGKMEIDDEDVYVEDVWSFSLGSLEWKIEFNSTAAALAGQPYPSAREDVGCAWISPGNTFVVVGGDLNDEKMSSEVWVFDVTQGRWENKTATGLPGLKNHAVVSDPGRFPDKVFVLGGEDSMEEKWYGFWVLDTSSWSWNFIPDSPLSAPYESSHSAVMLDGMLAVVASPLHSNMYVLNYSDVSCPFECSGAGSCVDFQCQCDKGHRGVDCNTKDVVVEYRFPDASALSLIKAASTFSIALCVLCAIAIATFRQAPAIKSSVWQLQVTQLLGCSFAFLTVHLICVSLTPEPEQEPRDFRISSSACVIEVMGLPIAFAMAYGAILSKVKATYDAFNFDRILKTMYVKPEKKKKKKITLRLGWAEKYMPLISFVCVQLVMSAVLILTNPVDPQWVRASSSDMYAIAYVASCNESSANASFRSVLGMINGSMLVYGAYMAYKTRHMVFFVDAKMILVVTYVLACTLAPAFFLAQYVRDTPTALVSVIAGAVFVSVYAILFGLTIPILWNRHMSKERILTFINDNIDIKIHRTDTDDKIHHTTESNPNDSHSTNVLTSSS